MSLKRRQFVSGISAAAVIAATLKPARAISAPDFSFTGFGFQTVIDLARNTARKAYVPPSSELPEELASLGYDAYRGIRFLPEHGPWKQAGLGYHLEFFHRGGLSRERIDIFEVHDGKAVPFRYETAQFTFDPRSASAPAGDIGYAGFRIHAHNIPGMDEMAVFLGASYFRSLAANQTYGLSGRGLALATASARGEEFPIFRSYWIVRPKAGDPSVQVYALLDSPSVTGAYAFKITPGTATVYDIECTLYPRVTLDMVGIAPLTAMYLYGPADQGGFDDFRGAVHDADGLQLRTGSDEAIWRALANPPRVEESAFQDTDPHGFGLMQREQSQAVFEDYEARYDLRPSGYVTPKGDWGKGAVHLIELPSNTEGFDNIVAFWRPATPLSPRRAHSFNYTVTWGAPSVASLPAQLGRVVQTRTGHDINGSGRVFIVDFALKGIDAETLNPVAESSAGTLSAVRLQTLNDRGVIRASFHLELGHLQPEQAKTADLRLALHKDATALTETWMFRWTY
ncbi:glucan biosynthesis protein [Asticcacaulis machinosus]|uniref:Glucan biosynthesis protein G n=1 Tax=Asticcacaulis machinosus TaxID=2984211 RepID=A0ABT5HM28_9CAUL|nr:glucan biosynthesis protein G [Asticcacaulis machinosus]MDC7677298.1 glucan biosynthesis protein G [Asticcacaulis machinosus]